MPKLSTSLCESFCEQVRNELESAYLYLNMSAQCSAENLRGAAHWLRKQWEEELVHALKLMDYVLERGNQAELRSISKPDFTYDGLTKTFHHVLEHEQQVTKSIFKLYELATKEQDYAAQTFLQWFITEQVEEENSAQEILEMLKVAGEEGPALFMVDRQLGQRA